MATLESLMKRLSAIEEGSSPVHLTYDELAKLSDLDQVAALCKGRAGFTHLSIGATRIGWFICHMFALMPEGHHFEDSLGSAAARYSELAAAYSGLWQAVAVGLDTLWDYPQDRWISRLEQIYHVSKAVH